VKKRPSTTLTSKYLHNLSKNLLFDVDKKRKTDPQALLDGWKDLLQEPLRSQTKPLRYEEGILYVAVLNSPLLSVLELYQKKTLLAQMQSKFPKSEIRAIRFRLG